MMREMHRQKGTTSECCGQCVACGTIALPGYRLSIELLHTRRGQSRDGDRAVDRLGVGGRGQLVTGF